MRTWLFTIKRTVLITRDLRGTLHFNESVTGEP